MADYLEIKPIEKLLKKQRSHSDTHISVEQP